MADLYEVKTLLDFRTLTETYSEAGRENLPPNPFFDFYTGGTVRNIQSDEVEFIKLSRVKDPAPLNARGAPARVLQPTGKEKRTLAGINVFDVLKLSMNVMQMIRHPEQWAFQRLGEVEIGQQLEDFATRHALTKRVYMAKMFEGATLYINANGDILESSSAAVQSISSGIPSGNLSTMDVDGGGAVIGTNWNASATDADGTTYYTALILDQLEDLNIRNEKLNRRRVTEIWMNAADKKYIRGNMQIRRRWGLQGRMDLDRALADNALQVEDYTFRFFAGTYTNTSGTNSFYIPAARAVITPKPNDGNWLAQYNGLQLVPSTLDVAMGLDAALSGWEEVYGDFAYFLREHNPPGLNLFMGFNWLLGFRDPSNVYAPTIY